MRFFLLGLTLASLPAMAALDLTPGLWTIDMQIEARGKKIDPSAEMKKAMAKLSPEQRQQMAAMMGQQGAMLSPEGTKVCYTKEMLSMEESIARTDKNEKCKTSKVKATSKRVETTFVCEDGTKGDAVWTVENAKLYKGLVNITEKTGQTSKINYTGKFASSDCGKVKPTTN